MLAALGFSLSGRDAAVAFLSTLGLAFAVSRRSGASPAPSRALEHRLTLVSGAAALFCAALMEEVLFRAYFLENLRGLGTVSAVLVSSGLFTVIHFLTNKVTPASTFGWMVGGVSLAAVYLLSCSVLVVTFAHLARNLGNALFVDPSLALGDVVLFRPAGSWARSAYYASTAAAVVLVSACVYA